MIDRLRFVSRKMNDGSVKKILQQKILEKVIQSEPVSDSDGKYKIIKSTIDCSYWQDVPLEEENKNQV